MRNAPILLVAAVLCGCGDRAAGPEPENVVADESAAPEPAPDANAESPVETADSGPGALPPQTEAPRFVGRWAANTGMCEGKAWVFSTTTLATPAGSRCTFEEVTQVPGGYDIRASCTAEGPVQPDTLKIRFAESAQAMLFESESIADAGLIFCGRPA